MSNFVPDGWMIGPLTEYSDLKHGYQFRTPDFSESGVKVIKIGQVEGNGKLNLSTCDYVRSDFYQTKKEFSLKTGDILMSLTGNIGRVSIVPPVNEPLLQNYRVGLFNPKKGCDKTFLFHLLGSEFVTNQLLDKANSTAQANFGKSDLDKVVISIPPKAEQQKIASILTSVDEVIEKTEAQISKLQDLKKGMMQELLAKGIGHSEFKDSPVGRIPKEWAIVTLDSISKKITDGEHQTPKRTESGYYLLSARNIRDGHIALEDVDYIPEEEYIRISKRVQPQEGDILISCSGTIGRTTLVPPNLAFSMVRSVAIVKPKRNSVDSVFLAHVIASPLIQEQIKKSLSQLAQANLFQAQIKALKLVLPNIDEQVRIGKIASSIDQRISSIQNRLDKIKSTKKALMQDLLTGKVRVKTD